MTVSRLPNNDGGIQPTILTNKGDLLTASATSTVTNLPVGSNDQVLVADSTQTTGLSWKSYGAQGMAGKNAVINGGMDIWQRGTSFSVAASTNTYTADRWYISTNANQASTIARYATSDSINLPNIQYCVRVQRNSGQTGTGSYGFWQNFETVNSIPFAGKTVTTSFYARAGATFLSSGASLTVIGVMSGTGTDQNLASGYTGQVNGGSSTVALTSTWQRFTVTATVPTNATELTVYFSPSFVGTAGASDYFEITGVQLELGSVATPFSRAGGSIQGELAACQRYYWRYVANGVYTTFGGTAPAVSTTNTRVIIQHPVRMRTAPTSVDYANMSAYDGTNILSVSAMALTTQIGVDVSSIDTTVTGATQYRPYSLLSNNNTNSYIGLSAEL